MLRIHHKQINLKLKPLIVLDHKTKAFFLSCRSVHGRVDTVRQWGPVNPLDSMNTRLTRGHNCALLTAKVGQVSS